MLKALLMGRGQFPEPLRERFRREGVAFMEEGLYGSVMVRGLMMPGSYASMEMQGTGGAIAITRNSYLVVWIDRGDFRGMNINTPIQPDGRPYGLTVHGDHQRISFSYDLSHFHYDRRGLVRVRFKTPSAPKLIARLNGSRPAWY